MVKIKQKKTMNLPQLIEWAYHQGSDVRDEKIKSESMTITFSEIGTPHIETKFHFLQVDELFTVEVEEAVDSDTVLDNIYTVNVEVGTSHTTYYKSKSINDVKTDEINIVYTILQEEAIVLWDSQGGFR